MDHPSLFTSSPLQNTPPNDLPAPVLVPSIKPRNKLGPGGVALLEGQLFFYFVLGVSQLKKTFSILVKKIESIATATSQ